MLRGSVGFLLQEPQPEQGSLVPSLLKDAVEEATQALTDLASGEAELFDARVDSLSLRAVNAVKKIVKTLNESDAEIKIVGTGAEIRLDRERIVASTLV
jgi:3-hydroxy-3-methylglutaryl CoA synthase